MLAQTLRALERDGLVERRARPVIPPHVEYRLSAAGVECARYLEALSRWLEAHVRELIAARSAYDEAREA